MLATRLQPRHVSQDRRDTSVRRRVYGALPGFRSLFLRNGLCWPRSRDLRAGLYGHRLRRDLFRLWRNGGLWSLFGRLTSQNLLRHGAQPVGFLDIAILLRRRRLEKQGIRFVFRQRLLDVRLRSCGLCLVGCTVGIFSARPSGPHGFCLRIGFLLGDSSFHDLVEDSSIRFGFGHAGMCPRNANRTSQESRWYDRGLRPHVFDCL